MNRNEQKAKAIAVACLLAVGLGTAPICASASGGQEVSVSYETEEAIGRKYLNLATVTNKSVWAYTRKAITIGSSSVAVKGLTINGVEYIPFRAAANAIGASYSYSGSTGTMKASGLVLTSGAGCYVSYGNDRVLFSSSPTVMMNDGRLYIPAEIFAKAIGMKLSASDSSVSLTGKYSPILNASSFYRADEVLWLARIIHAESAGEPLLGQIAVGNVVLNRVKSSAYPNTIYGVIFDRKYGVQFSPVLNGTIYNTPSYNATLAAKICLEGIEVTDGALFFLEPSLSTSSWIPNNRQYSFTIGRHDFYK